MAPLLPSMGTVAALLALTLALVPVVLLLLRPSGRAPVLLSGWPAPVWLYLQALAAVVKLGGKSKKQPSSKAIQVSLARPVHFSPTRLRRYLALAGFRDGSAGEAPLLYPMVEGFRLVIQCMVLPAFPFNVLGSVLARTRVVALRRVGAEEKLLYSCRVDPAFRTTPKGDTEVDLAVEAHAASAAGPSGGGGGGGSGRGAAGGTQLVWRCVTTAIILSPKRSKGAKPAAEPAGAAAAAAADTKPVVMDTWRLGSDTGRRYGMLNGDLNPIHLYPATSSLFGFKRPIAHALYLTGRAEASMRNAGLELRYPCVLSADFKRPTLLPATLHCAWLGLGGGGGSAVSREAVAAALGSMEGARFVVMTEDLGKEVLGGSVTCAAEAVKAALGSS